MCQYSEMQTNTYHQMSILHVSSVPSGPLLSGLELGLHKEQAYWDVCAWAETGEKTLDDPR